MKILYFKEEDVKRDLVSLVPSIPSCDDLEELLAEYLSPDWMTIDCCVRIAVNVYCQCLSQHSESDTLWSPMICVLVSLLEYNTEDMRKVIILAIHDFFSGDDSDISTEVKILKHLYSKGIVTKDSILILRSENRESIYSQEMRDFIKNVVSTTFSWVSVAERSRVSGYCLLSYTQGLRI